MLKATSKVPIFDLLESKYTKSVQFTKNKYNLNDFMRLTLLVHVTRPIREETTHSSVVFNFCVAVGN